MKNNNCLNLALIFLFLFSCSKDKERDLVLSKTLILKDSLIINLPDTIPHIGSLVRPSYSTTNASFSYPIDKGDNLEVYTFNKDSVKWRVIVLNKNGPDQVYGNGAYNLTDNGLVYLPFNTPKVLKLNNQGLKIWEKSYFGSRDMVFDTKVKNPVIHDDEESVFFDLGSYVDFNDPSIFEKTGTVGKYDYLEDKFYALVNYPEEFHGNTWSGNDAEHHLVIRDNLIYMNFVKSEFIYVYDTQGKFIKKDVIKSKNIKNSKGKKHPDSMQNAIQQVNNGHYVRLIHDPWRDVFYRIGVYYDVSYEVKSAQDVANAFRRKKLVVLTFDKDLNVLGNDEFDVTTNRLNEYYTWMSEDGLLIYQGSLENSDNQYQFAKLLLTDISLSAN